MRLLRKPRPDLPQGLRNLRGRRPGITRELHFAQHEELLDQAVRHPAPRGRAEFRLFAVEECGDAQVFENLAGGDGLAIQSSRDPVDRLRAERRGEEQDRKEAPEDPHQNACPREKWNWKWLICCTVWTQPVEGGAEPEQATS